MKFCRHACALSLIALVAACSSSETLNGSVLARANENMEEEEKLKPTIESVQKHVFGPHCISCHAGSSPESGMRLDNPGNSYNNLVNVRRIPI